MRCSTAVTLSDSKNETTGTVGIEKLLRRGHLPRQLENRLVAQAHRVHCAEDWRPCWCPRPGPPRPRTRPAPGTRRYGRSRGPPPPPSTSPQSAAGDAAQKPVEIRRPAQPHVVVAGGGVAVQPGAPSPTAGRCRRAGAARVRSSWSRPRRASGSSSSVGTGAASARTDQHHPVGHPQAAFGPGRPAIVRLVDHAAIASLLLLQPPGQHRLPRGPLGLSWAMPGRQKPVHTPAAQVQGRAERASAAASRSAKRRKRHAGPAARRPATTATLTASGSWAAAGLRRRCARRVLGPPQGDAGSAAPPRPDTGTSGSRRADA